MSIKATVEGTAYNGITTINAGGKAITLAETGTIATPTATKTQSITANGTISVDVENYKTITITTNVQSSSGGSSGSDTTVTLSSISATYTGGSVDAGTSVNDLTGITVTATYSDSSTAAVTGYTLSGTIAEGSNTVTVTYQGKTATFTVTGNAASSGETDSEDYDVITPVWVIGTEVSNGGNDSIDGLAGSSTGMCSELIDLTNYSKFVIYCKPKNWTISQRPDVWAYTENERKYGVKYDGVTTGYEFVTYELSSKKYISISGNGNGKSNFLPNIESQWEYRAYR